MSRCLFLSSLYLTLFCSVAMGTHICRAEQGDLSELPEWLFINDLPFPIKMSCDICDAWPGTGAGGGGVPQGAELGPLALAPRWCQLWIRQLWLSASWFRSTRRGWWRKRKKNIAKKKKQLQLKSISLHNFFRHKNCCSGGISYQRNSSRLMQLCFLVKR